MGIVTAASAGKKTGRRAGNARDREDPRVMATRAGLNFFPIYGIKFYILRIFKR
jgi:hypothetical protein